MATSIAREILRRHQTNYWRVFFEHPDVEFAGQLVPAASEQDAVESILAALGDEAEIVCVEAAAIPGDPATELIELLADAHEELAMRIQICAGSMRLGAPFAATSLGAVLPPALAQFYNYDVFCTFLDALAAVAGKLAVYPDTYLACMSEELAAHALLNEAMAVLSERQADGEVDDHLAQLLFDNLLDMRDGAFEDWDVLAAFDETMSFGTLTSRFHPDEWNVLFEDGETGIEPVRQALAEATISGPPATSEPGLLDGLLTCGGCGGAMVRVGDEYVCTGEAPILQ